MYKRQTENSVYVAGDGSVRWASVETYQQGSYTEDDLKNSAGQKIIDFNSGLGKAASYEKMCIRDSPRTGYGSPD